MGTAEGMLDVLVVGAGISGLTLGWHLKQSGRALLVCQADDRVGGAISSAWVDGFLCEGGPNSFQDTPLLRELLSELQLDEQLVVADGRLPRFLWWDGRLRPLSPSPAQLLRSDLLTWAGKLRLASEFFVPPLGEVREETVAEFVQRRFGDEVLARIVEPFVGGVFAGDAGQLGIEAAFPRLAEMERRHGSVLRALWQQMRSGSQTAPRLCTLKEGLAELPHALARRLQPQLRLDHRLEALEMLPEVGWRAVFRTSAGESVVFAARTVVLATPAYVTAHLLQPLDATLARALGSIYYPPVAVVNLAYSKSQLPQISEGFGHLIPRSQVLRSLGAIYNSIVFPHTAPPNWRLFSCFLGGAADPSAANLDDSDLAGIAHRELQAILGFQSGYQLLRITRWPQAIPQYALGHLSKRRRIEQALERWPGLFIGGNAFGGIALGDCVASARSLASQIDAFLSRPVVQDSLRPA